MKAEKSPKGKSTLHIPDDLLKDVENSDIDRYSMYLFAVLLSYCDNNRQCFPSMDTLCVMNKCSKSTLKKRLDDLKSKEYIKIEKRHHSSNKYTLLKIPRKLLNKTLVSRELITNEAYSIDEKIVILCTLNDMQLTEMSPQNSLARLEITINEICKLTGMSWSYGLKITSGLESKGAFSKMENGFLVNLDLIGQAFIYLNKKVDKVVEDVVSLKAELESVKKELALIKSNRSNIQDVEPINE